MINCLLTFSSIHNASEIARTNKEILEGSHAFDKCNMIADEQLEEGIIE